MKEKKNCVGEIEVTQERSSLPSCIDKLREELCCAICLEICFEPCTTQCGHSFCRNCLQVAAVKCDNKCPKCRKLISIGLYPILIVNTVMWNTIQLLFPQEVEARKVALKKTNNVSFSASQEALQVNVEPFAEYMSGFGATLSRFSRGDVIEMKLQVMEKNNEGMMTLEMKELKLMEPANQRLVSIFSKLFCNIFCM